MQHRDGDLLEFFSHETQQFPPSLSDYGNLYLTNKKSDILHCLEQNLQTQPPVTYDCKVFDGAAVAHMLNANIAATFDQYADVVFISYILQQLQNTTRVDVVWDKYVTDSLKETTRDKRGKGLRRKVAGQTKLPRWFDDFLKDSTNKTELFNFLSSKVANFTFPQGKEIYITAGDQVVKKGSGPPMANCDHEEADSRIMVHVHHALEQGRNIIQIRTVDSDVVVILIGHFHELVTQYPEADIWVAFNTGKNFCYYHINTICAHLGALKSQALPVFHSFSGCDTTSAFKGKGKISAWQAWKSYDDVTSAFLYIMKHPFNLVDIDSEQFKELERLTVVLYDKTSPLHSVNEVRKDLFTKDRSLENIPPTRDTLHQHILRMVYQAGIWSTSLFNQQNVPSPDTFGWKKVENVWTPVWMTIPQVSRACRELIKCTCKVGDCSSCSCGSENLPCTTLCKCKCRK